MTTSISPRDPWRSIFSFPRWIDEFQDSAATSRGLKIHETDKNIVVEAVVAGVPSEDVEVHIEDGVITIKAEAKAKEEKQGEFSESTYRYYYSTALSGGQWDKAEAQIEHGVVKIDIPKAESAKPRKIAIKTKK